MSKFTVVETAPENLKKNEIVIHEPDFVKEINLSKNQPRPVGDGRYLTSLAHLRSITGTIGELYDPDGFNPYSTIPFNHFVGIEYADAAELSPVVLNMFKLHHPNIFFKYLDNQIKNRPQGTELIYFVGPHDLTEAFLANGIDLLDVPVTNKKSNKESKKVIAKEVEVKAE